MKRLQPGLIITVGAALCLSTVLALMGTVAWAQELQPPPPPPPVVPPTETVAIFDFSAPHFFAALVAGVVLAFAFQWLLTNLSIAAGLNILATATHPVFDRHEREQLKAKKHREERDRAAEKHRAESETGEHPLKKVREFSTTVGIWAIVTASVALFFASFLAVELSQTVSTTVGLVLGLVIWGLFTLAIMTIEANAVSSLAGAVFNVASSGLKAAKWATAGVIVKSPKDEIADTAAEVAKRVRREMFGDMHGHNVRHQIKKYVNAFTPGLLDPKRLRRELKKIFDDTEIRMMAENDDQPLIDADAVVMKLEAEHGLSREHGMRILGGVRDAINTIIHEMKSDEKSGFDKFTDAAVSILGDMSPDEAQHYRERAEEFLRHVNREELDPDGLKRDLWKMFDNPRAGAEALSDRLKHIDRETVTAVLAEKENISHDEAKKIVDQFYSTVKKVAHDMRSGRDYLRRKLHDYLVNLGMTKEAAEGTVSDLRRLFVDPKASAEDLINRIKSIDRDTIVELVAARTDLTEDEANMLIDRLIDVRDDVLATATRMRDEIKIRLEDLENQALYQADEIRKTSATAAWWAFGTAVTSGAAAAFGGVLAAGIV